MKIKKILILGVLAGMYSNTALAEVEIGVGTRLSFLINVTSNYPVTSANYISIPIKISNKFVIDTELIYLDAEDSTDGDIRKSKVKGVTFGGFYYGNSISLVKPYFGVKAGIAKSEEYLEFDTGNVVRDTSETVKTITPVIGAEIEIMKNFTIAGELGFAYSKSKNTDFMGTDSRLVTRFYF